LKATGDTLNGPGYMSRDFHDDKLWDKKQRKDIGKYSFVNRTSGCRPTAAEELENMSYISYIFIREELFLYYLNTVTRSVSKHTTTVLSCYHINITLTQSHVPSVNTQLQSCQILI
jgi:hypothetical protein